ncbi:beta-galactosidase trimerization domain-containing protein, partial [Micrococcus sp. SIMBA_131]
VLVVPVYFLTDPAVNEKISRFAEQGGTVILSYRAGVKEQNNFVVEDTLPGALRELAGVEINEYESLQLGQNNEDEGVQGAHKGVNSVASIWVDLVEPTTAEVRAKD